MIFELYFSKGRGVFKINNGSKLHRFCLKRQFGTSFLPAQDCGQR